MYLASVLAGVVAFASARVIHRDDPYVGDLRTFTVTGCYAENQGVGTFTESMVNICQSYPLKFSSISIHLTDGWTFRAYSTPNCKDPGTIIKRTMPGDNVPLICNNNPRPWVAYMVVPMGSWEDGPCDGDEE